VGGVRHLSAKWRLGFAAVALAFAGRALVLAAPGGALLQGPPEAPQPDAHYLFYLHGKIVEDQGRRPKHPSYGVYEYDALLQALQASGAIVISEQRPAGTQPASYAKRIAQQVRALLDHGVPAAHVAVVGFSKGGAIVQLVSAQLDEPELRYVLLAACPEAGQGPQKLHGKVLAIRERSDSVPSCAPLFARSKGGATTSERVIAIGGAHGAFYRPNDAWLAPVLEFVR
jgi:hypothetical protein